MQLCDGLPNKETVKKVYVGEHLATYRQFPPRQEAGSFSLDQMLKKLQQSGDRN